MGDELSSPLTFLEPAFGKFAITDEDAQLAANDRIILMMVDKKNIANKPPKEKEELTE